MVTLVSVGTSSEQSTSEQSATEGPRFGAVVAIAIAIAAVLGFAVGFAVMRQPGIGAPELRSTERSGAATSVFEGPPVPSYA